MSRGPNPWLWIATGASFALALLHLAMIPVGAPAYRFFTAGERIVEMAERGSPIPALLTFTAACAFAAFGLYGAAVIGYLRLPAARVVFIVAGCIYTLRGALVVPEALMVAHLGRPPRSLVFAAVALLIGVVHLIGAARQWPMLLREDLPAGQTREL